jgi:hypothetical protein
MKLHQTFLSPFPTRVRLMLYAKGIDFEILEPHGFHGDPRPRGDYEDVNPIGRIPTLVLADGTALPESKVICDYSAGFIWGNIRTDVPECRGRRPGKAVGRWPFLDPHSAEARVPDRCLPDIRR